MSRMQDAEISQVAAAIRAQLMNGRAPLRDFASAIGKSPRTVHAYIAQGMPVEYVGKTPYPVVADAIAWLRSRRQRCTPPRSRGRPKRREPNTAAACGGVHPPR
jgi:hypothetical protein